MKSKNQNGKEAQRLFVICVSLILLMAVYMYCVYAAATNIEKNNVREKIFESIEVMKDICLKYEDYTLSISTKEMQSSINKINILREYTDEIDVNNKNDLAEYAAFQYITGIFVLDEKLNTINSVDMDGIDRTDLIQSIIKTGNVRSVAEYPKKVFAGHMDFEECSYNYAVAARTDAPGVIICYIDITQQMEDDKYEFSLSTMLPSDIFGEGSVFAVGNGEEVVYTNRDALYDFDHKSELALSIIEKHEMKEDIELVKVNLLNDEWYGIRDSVRGYYLYIFYPSEIVFADRMPIMMGAFVIYMLICALFALWLQYSRRQKLLQIEKEYHLVNAIASIYNNNVLVDLKERTFEVLIQSDNMKAALEDTKKDAESIFKAIADNFIVPNAQKSFLKFTDMNTAAERLHGKSFLGYTFEGVGGKWYQALLIPQTRDPDDEVTAVMLVTRDVSEQRRKDLEYRKQLRLSAEKANRANAAKTDFLRRMNHDIRTPINGIIGMLEINSRCSDEEIVRANREKAKTAAHHLLSLINDVLEMSKLEDGIVNVEKERFDIKELADDVMVIIGMRADEQGITLYPDDRVENFAYRYVYGNPLHVRQIFLNIMGNSIKYNKPDGSISCTTEVERVENGKVWYKFTISDTGIGMSEEFIRHIFEPFAQEKSDARTVYRGTGLGMSIVKTLLESMDGTIEIESKIGVGSTFYVTIPFEIAEDDEDSGDGDCSGSEEAVTAAEAADEKSSKEYDKDNADTAAAEANVLINAENTEHNSDAGAACQNDVGISGMNILVAEDNELNMEIAKFILEDAGASVHTVSNGAEAAEAFVSSPSGTYDAILMDIMMPVMDGYDALKVIRSVANTRPDAAEIPIIAMTANAFADDRQKSYDAGMNGHITKPLDMEKMISILAEFRKN